MARDDELPELSFETQAAFEAWLAAHHDSALGLRLKIAKKASGRPTVTFIEAIETALCYGWIDGKRQAYDESYFLQRFTPRRARSSWSQVNTERVARLIGAGRMQPAGLAEVDSAKADGRWAAAYPPASKAEPPEDLRAALSANRAAAAFFATLPSASRYAVIYRIISVKRPETRARNIAKFVTMLANGEAPWLFRKPT